MAQNIPAALEHELQRFSNMQREYENLQESVQLMQRRLSELNMTLEELSKQPEDVLMYKAVGQVMFKVDKPRIVEEMGSQKETIEMRLAALTKKLETQGEKLKELQTKLQVELGKHNLRLQ